MEERFRYRSQEFSPDDRLEVLGDDDIRLLAKKRQARIEEEKIKHRNDKLKKTKDPANDKNSQPKEASQDKKIKLDDEKNNERPTDEGTERLKKACAAQEIIKQKSILRQELANIQVNPVDTVKLTADLSLLNAIEQKLKNPDQEFEEIVETSYNELMNTVENQIAHQLLLGEITTPEDYSTENNTTITTTKPLDLPPNTPVNSMLPEPSVTLETNKLATPPDTKTSNTTTTIKKIRHKNNPSQPSIIDKIFEETNKQTSIKSNQPKCITPESTTPELIRHLAGHKVHQMEAKAQTVAGNIAENIIASQAIKKVSQEPAAPTQILSTHPKSINALAKHGDTTKSPAKYQKTSTPLPKPNTYISAERANNVLATSSIKNTDEVISTSNNTPRINHEHLLRSAGNLTLGGKPVRELLRSKEIDYADLAKILDAKRRGVNFQQVFQKIKKPPKTPEILNRRPANTHKSYSSQHSHANLYQTTTRNLISPLIPDKQPQNQPTPSLNISTDSVNQPKITKPLSIMDVLIILIILLVIFFLFLIYI